jgi:starvation-inducible DNA-binding protein
LQKLNVTNTEFKVDKDKYFLALKTAFASEFAFYLKAHFFHWNVEGPNFPQYHELFGKIYEEVYGSIDDFAENIRKAGTYTPGSFNRFSMLSTIKDETEMLPAEQMLAELYSDSEKMANIFRITFDMAEQHGDHGLADFLAGRQDAHKKHSWMLRATMK